MPYEKSSPASPEAQSGSPIQDNLRALSSLFPSVVRDGQVDVDALRQLCGEAVVKEDELFGLNWRGKAEARRAALTPSLGTLRPCKEESKDWDTTQNLYIEGDNLEVLKLLRKSYGGKVKMIYIDPPYNTGNDFVYPDDYQNGIENYKKMTGQEGKYAANVESSGRYHTTWLNMMYPRLKVARELLTDDGAIFLSIGDDEEANLIKICDEIFGEQNFIASICHKHRASVSNDRIISENHNHLVFYAKDMPTLFSLQKQIGDDPILEGFNYSDEKGPYKLSPVDGPGGEKKGNPYYEFLGIEGFWRYSKETMQKKYDEGLIIRTEKNLQQKYYLEQAKESRQTVTTWWDKDFLTSSATKDLAKLMGGKFFDNPKNVNLILRALKMLTKFDSESIILDFFSGSATTAQAVMQLNAEDGGNRRFIMVQLPEPTIEGSEAYKAGYKTICEIGKERIRRAGEKVKAEAGLTEQNLDIGFRVYKLDSSNVKAWNPQAEDLATAVNNYAEHLVGGRTEEDFLTEIMLKSGIDLVEEVEERVIAGHRVQSLGFGQYYACMAADLAKDAEDVALGIAAWHEEDCAFAGGEQQDTCTVFVSDRAFDSNDAAKMNFVAILEQHGICNIKAL